MSSGECQTKNKLDHTKDDDTPIVALDEGKVIKLRPFFVSHLITF